jgi:hypothetical protein
VRADTATRREFIRYVYDEGGATTNLRNAFISTWRTAAVDTIKGGALLTATAANGHSAGFQLLPGWTAATVMELANWAREHISESSVDDALDDIPSAVRSFNNRTTNLHVYG